LPRAELPLDAAALRRWPLPPHEQADKRTRGTVLVVGGTSRTPGAILLAGTAALRVGAGRLQVATDPVTAPIVAVAVPEALVMSTETTRDRSLTSLVAEANAIVVGPGVLDGDHAAELVRLVLHHAGRDAVIVIDARCIPAAAAEPRSAARRGHMIITPNKDELRALLDGADDADEPELSVAERYGFVVASFGRVATPDGRVWNDPADVLGLGTSGAGDVLAGMAAGIAARCGDAAQAACWSTFTHRLAATRLAASLAPIGYLARELCDDIPRALATLSSA
jgi:hydroxyethylthiazole kinase-like uncharacterized protein yjeF